VLGMAIDEKEDVEHLFVADDDSEVYCI